MIKNDLLRRILYIVYILAIDICTPIFTQMFGIGDCKYLVIILACYLISIIAERIKAFRIKDMPIYFLDEAWQYMLPILYGTVGAEILIS